MSKKFLMGFAPLLALVAFAVVPAMAQAQGRWTVNDAPLVGTANVLNGSKLVTLTDAELEIDIECEVSSTGTITNPGTGNGKDSITAIQFKNCVGTGVNGTGCTATVTPENLPWSTVLNTAGTIDTIKKVTVKITLAGTCPDAGATVGYGSNTATLTDTITNDVFPPAGTPNCLSTVETLQSALSGVLTSTLGTKGTITGNVYVCTAAKAEVGVND